MRLDINKRLEKLIIEYDVDSSNLYFKPYIRACEIANEVFDNQCPDIVVLADNMDDLKGFFSTVRCHARADFYVYSSNMDCQFIQDKKVIYVSYRRKDEVKAFCRDKGIWTVSLYDEFERRNLVMWDRYYDLFHDVYRNYTTGITTESYTMCDLQYIYYLHRLEYQMARDDEAARLCLEKMIFDCAYVRDFLKTSELIEEYGRRYEGKKAKRYRDFLKEVRLLLKEIKAMLEEREQNVIMFWIDQIQYAERTQLPFLQRIEEKCLSFQNMYSVAPHTSGAAKSMFLGKTIIGEGGILIDEITSENSIVIQTLKQRDYRLQMYGYFFEKLFSEEFFLDHFYSLYEPVSRQVWDVLVDMADGEKGKCFALIHELTHSHRPYLSFDIDGNYYFCRNEYFSEYSTVEFKKLDQQRRVSREYADRQIEFWSEWIPDHFFKIYMSDHSDGNISRPDQQHHVFFMVQQEKVKPRMETGLYSYVDFGEIITNLLDNSGDTIERFKREHVPIENAYHYNKRDIEDILKYKKFNPFAFVGYQGIVTERDAFLRYDNGINVYAPINNGGEMITSARIKWLKSLIPACGVDYGTEEKFKAAKVLIRASKRYKKRMEINQSQKKRILNDYFDKITDLNTFAVRGGGLHTVYLLLALDEKNRRKVTTVIDYNPDCMVGSLGLRIITPASLKNSEIKTVLLSSFSLRTQWKEEMRSLPGIEVIDLYDLLRGQGISVEREFHLESYFESDFI